MPFSELYKRRNSLRAYGRGVTRVLDWTATEKREQRRLRESVVEHTAAQIRMSTEGALLDDGRPLPRSMRVTVRSIRWTIS